MKTVEEIREAVKALRNGGKVEGFAYTKSEADGREYVHVDENGLTYVAEGTFRIKIREYDPNAVEKITPALPEPGEAPERKGTVRLRNPDGTLKAREAAVCEKCGKAFEKSIYTKSLVCPDCRTRKRGGGAGPRELVCARCGKAFTVSKFHPYWTAEIGCPECRGKPAAASGKA